MTKSESRSMADAEKKIKAPTKKPSSNAYAEKFAKLGLNSSIDFILHLPIRYEDETQITDIAALQNGMTQQIEAVVSHHEIMYRPRRQLRITLQDEMGNQLFLRFVNFYGSQIKQFAVGQRIRALGEVRQGFSGLEMVHPKYRLVTVGSPLAQALTPVYSTTAGLGQSTLRRAIDQAFKQADLSETVPANLLQPAIQHLNLPNFADAIKQVHYPTADSDQNALITHQHAAWQRIKFDELLAQQLSLAKARAMRRQKMAPLMPAPKTTIALPNQLIESLPFQLTIAQNKVVKEIANDLARCQPMQRLLQGDVGCGKTIVAAIAAAQAIDAGLQVALMAPTELLVEQHANKMADWFSPFGIQVAVLSASLSASEKRKTRQGIADGCVQLVVGTHAVIQSSVNFAKLGLLIIDEQHRFGVEQRLALRNKAVPIDMSKNSSEINVDNQLNQAVVDDNLSSQTNQQAIDFQQASANNDIACHLSNDKNNSILLSNRDEQRKWEPHQLMMSATPIPRTLAMSYFADLDVSTIDMLPPGRSEISTKLINNDRRLEVIRRMHVAAQAGEQVYWVCPLIEESEVLQLQTVIDTWQALNAELPDLTVALLHGKLNASEKLNVMQAFKKGEIHVLVTTTVIEVGVDVPNASLMIIDHAERFGLAQLHQLRGRVGRGSKASVCVLLYETPLAMNAKERLKVMRDCQDGFEIAKRDLEIRGPGDFLGARQSGAVLLRFADLQKDEDLVDAAQKLAQSLLMNHSDVVSKHLARWLKKGEQFMSV